MYQVNPKRIDEAFSKDVDIHVNECSRTYPGFDSWPEDAQVRFFNTMSATNRDQILQVPLYKNCTPSHRLIESFGHCDHFYVGQK